MWGTPEDCTAVVRVMQNFEKLAAPHQGTGTLYDPKARLNFEDTPSPNTSKAFYNAERSPAGSQGSRSFFSMSSLARKSSKEREKDVQLLCAKGRISQLENESNSLQTERKRARIEQQKEIDVRQGELRRQVEKNSELQQQLKYVVDQEKNVRAELKGTRNKFEDFKKKTEEKVHSLQRQKLKLNAEVEESKEAFHKQLVEMRDTLTRQETENIISQNKLEDNGVQLEYYKKCYSEASGRIEELEEFWSKCQTAEYKIKELELKLARHEEAAEVAMTMQSQISKYYKVECENSKLNAENSYLKATNKSNILLSEKLNSCQEKLKRAEERVKSLSQVEIEYEKQRNFLKKWDVEGATDGSMRSREELLQEIARLQQNQVLLLQKHGQASTSARISSDALKNQSEELVELKVKLSEVEEQYNEQSEKIKQMMKKLSLVTTDRDGLRRVLNSYDSGDSSSYAPQRSNRVQHTEEQLEERNRHIEKLENDLKLAIEKITEQAKKYNKLKIDYERLEKSIYDKNQDEKKVSDETPEFAKQDKQHSKDLVEKLERENKRLLEKVDILEARIEQRNLQGDFDPSKVKVIHLSSNPFMQARQSKSEQMERLKQECEALRRRVKMLEEGEKTTSTHIERIVLDESSPHDVTDLKAQVSSAERKNQKLKEVFSQKIQEFRQACYILTGYRIDVVQDQQYRLKSMYAERSADSLLFQCNSNGKTMLLETDFSLQVKNLIDNYLIQFDSIPAFLSSVTLELFERQTQMIK